jgi:pimeloyl-ACP methyl ester carboxylesterase
LLEFDLGGWKGEARAAGPMQARGPREEVMIRKAYVDTAEGQIHYRYTDGGDGPPLVFFHMTASSSAAYVNLMEAMDGSIPMIAFDTPNYGESYRTSCEPSIAYIASVLLEALTNIGVERFHSFGHHTGVSIQCEMAIAAPHRVLSTVINGPNYATMDQNAYLIEKLAHPNPVSIRGTQFIWAWSRIKDNYPVSLWNDTEVQAEIMNRDTIDMLRADINWDWGYRAVFRHDLRFAMAKVQCPKFFVCGAEDLAIDFHRQACADYVDTPNYAAPQGGLYYIESHAADLAPHLQNFIGSLTPASASEARR